MQNFAFKFQAVTEKTAKNVSGLLYFAAPCILIKIEAPGRNNIIFGTFYRSLSSTVDNNNELTRLISCINNKFKDQLIFVGDFNYAHINWYNWTASGNVKNCDERFVDVLRKNGLKQHILIHTRQRADDEPHLLDLLITRDDIITNLQHMSHCPP